MNFFLSSILPDTGNEKTALLSKITILESSLDGQMPVVRFAGEIVLSSEQGVSVKLPQPIQISPDQKYDIQLEQNTDKEHYNSHILKQQMDLNGIKIRFLPEGNTYDDAKYGLVLKMNFRRI